MSTLTDHDVFWLARYAHNTLAPLFAEAQQVEPTTKFDIDMNFHNPSAELADGYINIYGHWKRDGMFLYSTRSHSTADIDKLAVKIRADIEKLKSEALVTA